MTEKRDAYVEKMKIKLDEWNTKIDALQAKADQVKPELKAEYQNQLNKLKEKRVVAEEKLKGLREPSKSAWEDLKTGAESAWEDLAAAIKSATSRYR